MAETTAPASSNENSSRPFPLASLILALVAGAAVWGFLHEKHPVFKVPSKYDIGMGAAPEAIMALTSQQDLAERKNGTLVFTIVGALLTAAVATATPVCCSAFTRLLAAIPWGAVWGAGTGYACVIAYQTLIPRAIQPTVADTAKLQSLLFALLGVGVGLLIGVFSRSASAIVRGVVGGALAGVVAGVAFPIIAALALSGHSVEGLIPEGNAVRALWIGLGFASIAIIVPLITPQPAGPPEPVATETAAGADESTTASEAPS